MKIAFTIKSLEGEGGGAERVLADVASGLAERGHEIAIFTFDREGFVPFYKLDSRSALHGLSRDANLNSIRPQDFVAALRDYRKHIAGSYDVAVGFMHSSYIPLALALAGTSTPVIASEHTSARHFEGRGIQRVLSSLAQRLAYAKTVVSPVIREEHPERLRRNLAIVPNPINQSKFASARDSWPDDKIILCPGVFREEKDHSTLIRAFDLIAPRYPDWRLRIVGDGPLRDRIRQEVSAASVSDRIDLPGFSTDMAREYAEAQFVVLPSRYESFGMAVAEGLASGRPAVSFADCAGARLLIEDGVNGMLAKSDGDRVERLADALERMMRNDAHRRELGSAGPATVAPYARETVIGRWEDLLRAAVDRSPLEGDWR